VKPLHILPAALAELAAAADWYEERGAGLGVNLVSRVQRVLHDISETPGSYPIWSEDARFRKAKVGRFPYIVFYQEREAAVHVVAIAHGRRSPGYWQSRSR
jgi:toxin ParE1/3/4